MNDHLVLSTAQLREMGLTSSAIGALVAEGRLTRLRRGYYTMTPIRDDEDRHRHLIRATVDLVDETNVLSHTSAAIIHGLPVSKRDLERVTMTRQTSGHMNRGPKLIVRKTALSRDEFERRDNFLVTTLARTVVDVARTSPFMWGVAAADAALQRGLEPLTLSKAVARQAGLAGIRRARQVESFADPRPESVAESLSRASMLAAGIPTPELQPELFDDDGEFAGRPDFFWEEFGVVGECDGMTKYTTLLRPGQSIEDVLRAEKEREMRFRKMGLWVTRWGWAEATNPERLRSVLWPALYGDRSRSA